MGKGKGDSAGRAPRVTLETVQSGTVVLFGYDFLFVINVPEVVSCIFPDIAFDMSNIAIFGYPSCV